MTLLGQKNPIVQNLLWNERPSLKKKNGDEASHDVSNKHDTEWRDTYSLVCNLANLNPNKTPKMNIVAKTKISELQRLCIAADMNYGSDQCTDFVYKPKHLVYNELCMVVRLISSQIIWCIVGISSLRRSQYHFLHFSVAHKVLLSVESPRHFRYLQH
jgi:hypothetical protein